MAGTITATVSGGRSIGAGVVFALVNGLVSALIGVALAMVGGAASATEIALAAIPIAFVYLAYFVARGRVPFLPWPPQLPARWLDRDRPIATALRYGTVWGLAYATPIRAGSLLVLGVLVMAAADPLVGGVCFAIVGLLRALPTAVTPLRPPHEERGGAWRPGWHRPLVASLDALMLAVVLALVAQTVLAV
jgi:hypothetical protein